MVEWPENHNACDVNLDWEEVELDLVGMRDEEPRPVLSLEERLKIMGKVTEAERVEIFNASLIIGCTIEDYLNSPHAKGLRKQILG